MENKLPDFVLADLYPNSIVSVNEGKRLIDLNPEKIEPLPSNVIAAPELKWFLGDNKKNILIIIAEENVAIISEESLNFLTKILAAFNCTVADVVISNHGTQSRNITFLRETFSPVCVLLFGVSTQQIALPFTVPYYQVQSYNNCQFITAPDLASLNSSGPEAKSEKTKLWISLKKVFDI